MLSISFFLCGLSFVILGLHYDQKQVIRGLSFHTHSDCPKRRTYVTNPLDFNGAFHCAYVKTNQLD